MFWVRFVFLLSGPSSGSKTGRGQGQDFLCGSTPGFGTSTPGWGGGCLPVPDIGCLSEMFKDRAVQGLFISPVEHLLRRSYILHQSFLIWVLVFCIDYIYCIVRIYLEIHVL